MSSRGLTLACVLFFGVAVWSACVGGGPPANGANVGGERPGVNAAKTNAEELALFVRLPYETEDIVWKEFPTNKKLLAALRFSNADADKIGKECSTFGPAESVSLPVETWFPEELVAQGEMSGDSALRGLACPANSFFQEPYLSGRIARIESTDYFVLEVSAK
ncbi:MAG: hypothetical protein WKF34_11585 [Pyrinomonadaceae bacterium]